MICFSTFVARHAPRRRQMLTSLTVIIPVNGLAQRHFLEWLQPIRPLEHCFRQALHCETREGVSEDRLIALYYCNQFVSGAMTEE